MIFTAIACEQGGNESIPIEDNSYCIEEILPCESQDVGQAFAFAVDSVIKSRPSLMADNSLKSITIDQQNFSQFDVNMLSASQWEFVRKITINYKESKSIPEFLGILTMLGSDVSFSLPENERDVIYNIISVLYYGLEQIYNTYNIESNLKSAIVIPLWILEPIWFWALAEPTCFGEIIALIASAGIVSYIVLTRSDCIEKYVQCAGKGADRNICSDCLQYCLAQEDWYCFRDGKYW